MLCFSPSCNRLIEALPDANFRQFFSEHETLTWHGKHRFSIAFLGASNANALRLAYAEDARAALLANYERCANFPCLKDTSENYEQCIAIYAGERGTAAAGVPPESVKHPFNAERDAAARHVEERTQRNVRMRTFRNKALHYAQLKVTDNVIFFFFFLKKKS